MCRRLLGHAPLTMYAAKEAIRRIHAGEPSQGEDLIRSSYGSATFKEGRGCLPGQADPQMASGPLGLGPIKAIGVIKRRAS